MNKNVQEIIRQLPIGVKDSNELEILESIDKKLDIEKVTKEDLEQIEVILESNKNNFAQYYWNFKERINDEKKYFEVIEERKNAVLEIIEKLKEEGKEIELLTSIESRINNNILTVRDLEELMNLTETTVKMEEEIAKNNLNMLVDEINRMYSEAEKELENCKDKLISDKYTLEEKAKIFLQTSSIIEKVINNAYIENLQQQNVISADEHSITLYARMELINQLRDVLTQEQIQELNDKVYELTEDENLSKNAGATTSEQGTTSSPIEPEETTKEETKEQSLKEINEKIEKLLKDIDEIDERYSNNEIDYTTWHKERTDKTEELENLKEELNQRIQKINERIDELQKQIDELDEKYSNNEIDYTTWHKERSSLTEELENLKEELKSSQEKTKAEEEKSKDEQEEDKDDRREIEKIEARIIENEKLIMDFLSENKEDVKVKVKTIITNSELDEAKKQTYLNRLDTDLTAEELNEIINENNLNDDCELIVSVIEDQINDLGNDNQEELEINEENKETIVEVVKEKLEKEQAEIENEEEKEKIQTQLDKLTTDCTIEDLKEIIDSNNYNNELVVDLLNHQSQSIEQEIKTLEEENEKNEEILKGTEKELNTYVCNHYTEIITKELENNSNLTEENKEVLKQLQDKIQELSKEETLDNEKLREITKELDSLRINRETKKIEDYIREKHNRDNEISQKIISNNSQIFKLEEENKDIKEKIKNQTQKGISTSKRNELQEKLEKFKNLNHKVSKEQKEAYYTIKENIVSQLEKDEEFAKLSPEDQCKKIAELIENHELRATFTNYEREEKLLGELVEEIYKTLNKEKEKEEEKPKKDWKKWGAAIAGLVTGVGLSFVPGPIPGVIIYGAKIAHVAAKPLIIKSIEKQEEQNIEKIKDGEEVTQTFKDKLNDLKLKIQKALVSKEFEYFLNGVAVGYGAGKMGQALYDNFAPPKNTPSGSGGKIGGVNPPQPTPTSIPGLGDTVDVRGIQGFVNSYGDGGTSIIQDLAKEAIIEKENNGFYHLIDRFGGDLGWFKISDIEQNAKMLKDVTTAVVKHVR